ncbi:MAG: 6-bladed beta-propeller [Bacteroidales bacterium]|jgi:hypothetical protein
MKIFWLFSFLFIVFATADASAINKNEKEGIIRINIKTDNFKSSANLSDFLEIDKLIPLETTKDCLIKAIKKVIQYRDNIYAFDLEQMKLFWFNSKGKFLGSIGQRGKGPGEYIEMHDFLIDTKNELIYLLDFRKIHIFSLKGKWIRSANTEFMAEAFGQSENDEFVFYGAGMDKRIFISDSNFKPINSFFPYSLAYRLAPFYPLSNYEKQILFHIPTFDTIYSLKDGKPEPLFYLDFNGKNFTENDFNRLSAADQNSVHDYIMLNCKYVRSIGFIPLKNSAIISAVYCKKAYWGICNLKTHQYSLVELRKLNNDIFGTFMYFHPVGITDDEYIFSMPAEVMIKDKTNNFYQKNSEILKEVDELSNPVLLFAKSKI